VLAAHPAQSPVGAAIEAAVEVAVWAAPARWAAAAEPQPETRRRPVAKPTRPIQQSCMPGLSGSCRLHFDRKRRPVANVVETERFPHPRECGKCAYSCESSSSTALCTMPSTWAELRPLTSHACP
jgi:hypothetical protein